jgi:predicted nucleic acid-binding protein
MQSSAVLDASGAIHLISSMEIERVFNRYSLLISPTIYQFEIGNVCWKYHPFSDLSIQDIQNHFKTAFEITSLIDYFDFEKILETALKFQLSFYDASYLSLAIEGSFHLISKDKKLNRAAQSAGLITYY